MSLNKCRICSEKIYNGIKCYYLDYMLMREINLVILLIIMVNFTPSTPVAKETNEEIIYAVRYGLINYNLYPSANCINTNINSATHARLFTRSHLTNDFITELASEHPVISFEGSNTIVDVSLKPGLKFYDGAPLTAADVVFSYKMALTPVVNHGEYSKLALFFDTNESIVEVNDLSIKFTINQNYSLYKNLLTLPIKSKAYHEPFYEAQAFPVYYEDIKEYNSAGPFMVTSYYNKTLTLEKNPNWYGSTPVLDKIIFNLLCICNNL